MYTRCPTCSTCFRVTERHLAIANGKVRCGQCQLVFNAPEHSIDDLPSDKAATPPPVQSKPSLDIKSDIKKTPKPKVKIAPAPVAPTAKEKANTVNLNKEPVTPTSPVFDSNATIISDLSTLNKNEVENVNLDSPVAHQNNTHEEDDYEFNNNFDMNAAIDKLAQSTDEQNDQVQVLATEEKTLVTKESNTDNIFQTDVYDTTSASSVADILGEMEGQLSLEIPDDDKDNVNNEFDFLELDIEETSQLKEKNESTRTQSADDFAFIEDEDNIDELNYEPIHEEHFEISLESNEVQDKTESAEEIELQNIGQHENDIPIQLRKDIEYLQSSSHRNWHPLLAPSILILLLVFSFSQLALFRAHDLVKQIPASKPMLEAFCEAIGCHYSGPRDTKQIQLLSRDVRLHPKENKALLISAAMINNANFAQPYPNIHIRLSDISGNVVAERIFNAKTYMGTLSTPFLLMKSQTPVHINFEVVDPGKDAINFEFNFL